MGTVYDIVFPDTIDTYEAFLGDIVTKLMPGFVSSAGTARGSKQLVFPDIVSVLTVSKQLYLYKRNTLCTLYIYPVNVYFKLFMHVSQKVPSHGVHWDSLPIPIQW